MPQVPTHFAASRLQNCSAANLSAVCSKVGTRGPRVRPIQTDERAARPYPKPSTLNPQLPSNPLRLLPQLPPDKGAVDRIQISTRAGLNHIGARAFARNQASVAEIDLQRHFT